MVNQTAVDHICHIYINQEHVIFDLVPQALCTFIEACYIKIGSPPVDCLSVWVVYTTLLHTLQQNDVVIQDILSTMDTNATTKDDEWQLIPGLQDLPKNDEGYMGGVGDGMGPHQYHTFLHSLVLLTLFIQKASHMMSASTITLWMISGLTLVHLPMGLIWNNEVDESDGHS